MEALLGFKLVTTETKLTDRYVKEYFHMEDGQYIHENDLDPLGEYNVVWYRKSETLPLSPDQWYLEPFTTKSRINHPAVKMWKGYEWALLQYQRCIVDEWLKREYIDTCWHKTHVLFTKASKRQLPNRMPPWLGDAKLHDSYKSLLIRKQPSHYRPLFLDIDENLDFVYPVL